MSQKEHPGSETCPAQRLAAHLVLDARLQEPRLSSTLAGSFAVCSNYSHAQNPFPLTLQLETVELFDQTGRVE